MTNELAIEILQANARDNAGNIQGEASKIGASAVAKQISQKPDYEGDGFDEYGAIIYDTAYCPKCSHMFEVYYDGLGNYCPECGQALDWSDTE